MSSAPLNAEASAGSTHLQVRSSLPEDVVQCLENSRFLHLATCTNNIPHVALMNYTYLPSTPYTSRPVIVMTTNPASKKTQNLVANPNVSLLVHDWISHRPPTSGRRMSGGSSPPPEAHRSSLASLLLNLNTSALSSISATINGKARLVQAGTDEEKFCREAHLENNTFGGDEQQGRTPSADAQNGDGGRGCFIEGEEVRVVIVEITDGRVSDWKGSVRDWTLEGSSGNQALVNGIAN